MNPCPEPLLESLWRRRARCAARGGVGRADRALLAALGAAVAGGQTVPPGWWPRALVALRDPVVLVPLVREAAGLGELPPTAGAATVASVLLRASPPGWRAGPTVLLAARALAAGEREIARSLLAPVVAGGLGPAPAVAGVLLACCPGAAMMAR